MRSYERSTERDARTDDRLFSARGIGRAARDPRRMTDFETVSLAEAPQVVAPDGSEVRMLPALARGSMIHFELDLGATSRAVAHRTVEEIWFVVSGRGDLW